VYKNGAILAHPAFTNPGLYSNAITLTSPID